MQQSKAAGKWRRILARILRYTLLVFTVMCLLVTVGFWVVTRSWFIVWATTPELERRLGGDVQIASAVYQGNGRITLTDMRLQARTLGGAPGELASISRAHVAIKLQSLLPPALRITEIDVEQAQIRASEDADTPGLLNFSLLKTAWPKRRGPGVPPPRVRIREASVEFGRHQGADFRLFEKRIFAGQMQPTPGTDEFYNFRLVEMDEQGNPIESGIRIAGELNAGANEWTTRIERLDLDDRIYRMCPQMVQAYWKRMELQGQVTDVVARWSPSESFRISLGIHNVDLRLPVLTGLSWARYRDGSVEETFDRPRMHFRRGSIIATGESLRLENLFGELRSAEAAEQAAHVPYEVVLFSMDAIPPLDWDDPEPWMEYVLKTAPFEFKFRVDEFRLKSDEAGAATVELPQVITKMLQKFRVTECVLSTTLDISRVAVQVDVSGRATESKTNVGGQVLVREASGQYQKFPYPVTNVDAYLEFDNEKLIVHSLTGSGSGNAKIRITGTVAPPDNDSAVALQLEATDVPIDARLREALRPGELKAFDMLFNRSMYESMAAGGYLPDEAALARASAELQQVSQELAPLKVGATGDAAAIARLEARETRLKRFLQAGAFQLGGVINLNLNIDRALGPRQRTFTTGSIDIQRVGLMYEHFPYPLRLTGGSLRWAQDRIQIAGDGSGAAGDGLAFVTPGGGVGTITGQLLFPESREIGSFRPDLVISVSNEEANEALYASIPPRSEERQSLAPGVIWPGGVLSPSAVFVRNIGLSGTADYEGSIKSNDQGKIGYAFTIALRDCRAVPNAEFIESIGGDSGQWPAGSVIDGINGRIWINRDGLALDGITAAGFAGGSLLLNGQYSFVHDKHWEISGSLKQARFEAPSTLDVLRTFSGEETYAVYESCQPVGMFEAEFGIKAGGEWRLDFQPRQVEAILNEKRVAAAFDGGTIGITKSAIAFDDLRGRHLSGQFIARGAIQTAAPVSADLIFSHVGQLRSDFAQACLPATVMRVLDDIEFFAGDTTALDRGHLQLTQVDNTDGAAAWRTKFHGEVRTSDASFDAGTKFSEIAGGATIDLLHVPGQPLRLELDIKALRARCLGQTLANVEANMALDDTGTSLQMPAFRARTELGVVAASAAAGVGPRDDYEIKIDMIDVPLSGFSLKDAATNDVSTSAPSRSGADGASGEIYASLSMSGHRFDPQSRRGRGVLRVRNGDMGSFPVGVALMQVAQFTIPFSGRLNFADVRMHMFGDRIYFEQILFENTVGENAMLQLIGEGEMDYNTLELMARFRSRGGVPIVRDIVGGVSDKLYLIEVTGTLGDPKARLVALPSSSAPAMSR